MRVSWYRHAWIAILLTVRKLKLQLYGDISISTCTDCDTVDRCKIRNVFVNKVIWDRHASIVILSAVRKVKVQCCVDNVMSACVKWRSVVQRCTFTYACNHISYAKLMESCSTVDFSWKRLAAQSSENWRGVVQNLTSTARCEKHNSANLMDCCSKVDLLW